MLNGLKLDGKKDMSITNEVVDLSDPNKVYVPLINNNVLCECITKVGKKVKKGTIIGVRKDLDFPILSPVSGTVVDIKKVLYLNNKMVDAVVIDNDKKEKLVKDKIVKDITNYTKEEFITLLKKCAVTGMGGSDFPTYLKYNANLDILIVNAVECEPYLTADLMLAKLKAPIILETIDAIMKINGIKKCFIAYKKKNRTIFDAFSPYIINYPDIYLTTVKDMYPMGWERHVVSSVLNVSYNKYPGEIGVVVNNISTIFSIYKALKFNRASTKRIVTISGEGFSDPINVLVKVGTNMSYVIRKIGSYDKDGYKIIAGGPMMGTSLKSDSVVASNNLNGLLILERTKDEHTHCMGCGRCLSVCPAKLCPIFILNNLDNKEELKKLNPLKCVECGLCSYVCPAKVGLRDAVKEAKERVRK